MMNLITSSRHDLYKTRFPSMAVWMFQCFKKNIQNLCQQICYDLAERFYCVSMIDCCTIPQYYQTKSGCFLYCIFTFYTLCVFDTYYLSLVRVKGLIYLIDCKCSFDCSLDAALQE